LENQNNELKTQIAKKEEILLEIMEKYDIYPNILSKRSIAVYNVEVEVTK